ncbi:MAG TPA: adenosylcobinamide-GDP ribazoletransferase, partial [Dongiaceae bacterium]
MPEEIHNRESDHTPQPLRDWWDDAKTAAAFLTRLPITPAAGNGSLAQASRAFPLVGLLVGGVCALIYVIAVDLGLTALLGAALAVAAGLILTGALHEDGLADLADG